MKPSYTMVTVTNNLGRGLLLALCVIGAASTAVAFGLKIWEFVSVFR